MNRSGFTPTLALLLGSAALGAALPARAQVPSGCVRISGEETPTAPSGFEADGTPVFCAPGSGPAASQGTGSPAAAATPLAASGWNGRLSTPLPGAPKPGGYGSAAGLGGSFQGRAKPGASSGYGQAGASGYGQSGYGQSGYAQSGYGQGGYGQSGYGSGASTGYGTPSGAGYGGSDYGVGTASSSDPYAPASGYDPYSSPDTPGPYSTDPSVTAPEPPR